MSGIDFSQPLLGAGASAKTDFAAAQARTGLNLIGDLQFKRGIKANIGVEAFADASAEFSKFIHAKISGTAFARAQAGTQLQLPLNLFDEFGFSVKAEAIAEAAAGLEVALGLSIGDFVLLAQRDSNLIGLPLEILLLFLEEVSIGGAFEVNVSASAKAHASISVSGSIVEKAGEKAGFYYTIDAGVGLAAGVGMGLKAGLEFKDFRRFYGRAVDKTVDSTIQEIIKLIPKDLKLLIDQSPINPLLEAFSPIAKISMRIAYDIGLKIAENNPGHTKNDAAILCDEAIKTFLEESQRFIFGKMLESGIDSLRKLIQNEIAQLPNGSWDSALQERTELANQLLAMPAEPFQSSSENLDYWNKLIDDSIALLSAIGSTDPELNKAISLIYSASELLMEAIRSKINTASSYATAIGVGTVNTSSQSFTGQLNEQPHPKITTEIRKVIGGNGLLTYADLIQFLINDQIVDNVLIAFPELNQFISIFSSDLAKGENELIKLLLQNARSFDPSNPSSTSVDSKALLTKLVTSIDHFLTDKFKVEILPQILNHVTDPTLKLYLEEVLFDAVVYLKDVGLNTILNWENETIDNDDFTEALAGVILLLLGRTVIVVGDTFLTAAQEKIQDSCNDIASQIRTLSKNQNGTKSEIEAFISHLDPELIELVADSLEIGGKVLGPLSDVTRRKVRSLLYQIFEPIPPGNNVDFLTRLGDDFFIPNLNQLQQVTDELAKISKDRFVLFVREFILQIGEYIFEKLEELILTIIDFVLNWEKKLAGSLIELADFLRNLEQANRVLNQEIIHLMSRATESLHSLFDTLGSSLLKNRIKNDLKANFVDKSLVELEDNIIYKNLPPNFKSEIRKLANGAVDLVIDNPITNPIFNAIALLANQLDDLLPDIKELDPDDNLPEQIMLLILDKIEENIKNHFGGSNPHISPEINFRFWVPDLSGGHFEVLKISLGRIDFDIDPFIELIRNSILSLNFYHTKLNEACFKLGNVLAKELEFIAQQLLHDENNAEKERIEKINSEHSNDPKEIAILSPAALSHYSKSIDVKIHLGGVSMSYLGIGKDEEPRVLIFINGELIPPKSLIADELDALDDTKHLKDFDFKNLVTIDSKSGKITNSFNKTTGIIQTSKSKILTDTSSHYPTQKSNLKTGNQFAFSTSKLNAISTSNNVSYSNSKNSPTDLNLNRSTKMKSNKGVDQLIHEYTLTNVFSGKKISSSKIDSFLQDRIPGIFVQMNLSLNEPYIVDGINVISVVVIERGGIRHQQKVSFTVTKNSTLIKPIPGVIIKPGINNGFIEKGMITLNTIIEHSKKKGVKSDLQDYLNTLPKEKIKVEKAEEKLVVPDQQLSKNETLIVIQKDQNGKESIHGKSIDISYRSAKERKAKLAALKLDNKTLATKNQRLKTEKSVFIKPLQAKGSDQKEIEGLIQTSKFIEKEEIEVVDFTGKVIKTVSVEYTSKEERKSILEKLKIDVKRSKSKSLETIEQITITDSKGKVLHTNSKSNTLTDSDSIDLDTYKPNQLFETKFKENVKKTTTIQLRFNDINSKNTLNSQIIENKPLISSTKSSEIAKQLVNAKKYLLNQSKLNLIKK